MMQSSTHHSLVSARSKINANTLVSSQHIQKLRKNRDTSAINAAAGGNTTKPPKPAPAKRAPAKKATAKAKVMASTEDDDDEHEIKLEKFLKEEHFSDEEEMPEVKRPAKRARKSTT